MIQTLETHPQKTDLQSYMLDLSTFDILFEWVYNQKCFWLSRTQVYVFHSMLSHMLDME